MATKYKVGSEVTISGKLLTIVGRDGDGYIAMHTVMGAIREYRITAAGKLERIN
jgi:hypothetical protein